jgi:pyridoxine 5-phosphate synthase
MPRLSVNVDHVATLREARAAREPDPAAAAAFCELAGAEGITVHLRADRRHIQDRDVEMIGQVCRTRLDLEMAATESMVEFALRHRPSIVTLVPERPDELTTEGGLNITAHSEPIRRAVGKLASAGLLVSLFVDPDPAQIAAAARTGAGFIEINTGLYAAAVGSDRERRLEQVREAARAGLAEKLRLAAGHGLDYLNVVPVARIEGIEELNIGHSIVARACLVGIDRAVRDMCALIRPVG